MAIRSPSQRAHYVALRAAPLVLVIVLMMLLSPTAQAVHDVGVFQLEGNAQTSIQSTPTAAEDWDLICKANPSTCTFAAGYPVPAGTTTATVSAHLSDGPLNGTIFTGGGSKDPQPLSAWAHKDQMGGLPDKDNLLHAFAARYNGTCDGSPCDLLYFGMDRLDNSGDAQNGFWFFKSPVSLNPNGTFNGQHEVGDLLILSDFSNGGTTSTINVYKWVGTGGDTNGSLDLLVGGSAAKCGGATSDAFCGIVNPSNGTTAPWTFTDKSGNSSYLQGEFYEGGINLSDPDINLGGTCFASFLSESRSSTSPTATLKDFVLGPRFGSCASSITSEQSWVPNDEATVGVTGIGAWSGTVTFTLFPNAICDPADTALYTSDPIAVTNLARTVSTNNTTAVDDEGTTEYSWQVHFEPSAASAAAGVLAETTCDETSSLTIANS